MSDKTKTEDAPEDALQKLCGLIEDIRIAMVTTLETDGSLRARPMSAQFLDDDPGHLYFLTGLSSHKVDELARDGRVNLSFAKGGDYVSVSGRGHVVRDPALIDRLWSEAARAWFPKGKSDPEIAVLAVDLDYGEYWDPPSGAVTLAYGWAKAVLTGKSADGDLGDNRKIGHVG